MMTSLKASIDASRVINLFCEGHWKFKINSHIWRPGKLSQKIM